MSSRSFEGYERQVLMLEYTEILSVLLRESFHSAIHLSFLPTKTLSQIFTHFERYFCQFLTKLQTFWLRRRLVIA